MTIPPFMRDRFYVVAGLVLAAWVGLSIAQEELFVPLLVLGICGLLLLNVTQPKPIPTLLLGVILVGYIAGNRGFAQLFLAPSVPLLPAELVLLVGTLSLVARSALHRQLPFRADAAGLVLLGWLLYGAVRLAVDFRSYRFEALRDSAMVYYAVFFYLAREAGQDPAARKFLRRCILTGCLLLLVLLYPFEQFPDFFLSILTFRGVPIIFYKGDLVGIFLAVGAVLLYLKAEAERSWWPLAASLAFAGATLLTNNRASMLGLAAATALLALGGRWRFAAWQAGAGAVAAVIVLFTAYVSEKPLEQTQLYGFYERVASIIDPAGQRQYLNEESANKGDNNLFRFVWWQAVLDETVAGNPYTGLGFGHDLAERFVREYYPDSGDEFTARSPHNIILTIFARMGAIGLLIFLGFIGLMATRTVRAIRGANPEIMGYWCSAWVILVSACFGVVLEGPMGAVVFWTLLGLASAAEEPAAEEPLPLAEVHSGGV